eukprot:CAMPEP_0185025558 /NCGR_PEP_ID=MMETSP1103-20130426/8467_1 /TAXON_ID=36769 /ORGANISM="Paraphysomonas bandaiensis, Strain Caron Lab Isolate" /LENGTH=245 /DNA_ID=CAMNT_0027558779 /DNA_START=42 /DNA_END=779 /DNA_ORIENTATION=+
MDEIYHIDDEDIDLVCTHFNNLHTEIKTQKWSEAGLCRHDKKDNRIILTHTCKKHFIPESITKKYLAQNEIRKHDNNQITLQKIMKRVTDLVNACCRPSTESRVKANDDRFDVAEILPSKNGIMILMAIWSKALLRMRDEILRIRNSKIEYYDGKTMDDIIRDMELDHVLPRGHYLRSRVPKRAKRRIMEHDGIDADEYKRSHLRRRVGSFDHEHIVFKPHEVEVVEAELEDRMRAHGIPATPPV